MKFRALLIALSVEIAMSARTGGLVFLSLRLKAITSVALSSLKNLALSLLISMLFVKQILISADLLSPSPLRILRIRFFIRFLGIGSFFCRLFMVMFTISEESVSERRAFLGVVYPAMIYAT